MLRVNMRTFLLLLAVGFLLGACTPQNQSSAPVQQSVTEEGESLERGPTKVEHSVISDYVRSKKDAVGDCYKKELETNPTLAGRIIASWSIDMTGAVSNVEIVEDSMNNDAINDCLVAEIEGWKFPEIEEEKMIRFPFAFSPTEEVKGEVEP